MKKKNFLSGLLVIGLLVTPTSAMAITNFQDSGMNCVETSKDVTLHVDGKYIYTDVDPVLKNNRTLVPMRAAGEALKADVSWDADSRTAIATKDGKTVKFTLGMNYYSVNGKTYKTDVAPIAIKNRTMLPIRAFADAFGVNVNWNHTLFDVEIDTPALDFEPFIPNDSNVDAQKYISKYYVTSDLSDPYVGSWHKRVDTFYNSVVDYYMFVSKLENGNYNVVEVSIDDVDYMKSNIITIMKDNSTFAGNDEFANFYNIDYDQIISYYRGPARGWELSFTHTYRLETSLDTLVMIKNTDCFGESHPVWDNEHYSRF